MKYFLSIFLALTVHAATTNYVSVVGNVMGGVNRGYQVIDQSALVCSGIVIVTNTFPPIYIVVSPTLAGGTVLVYRLTNSVPPWVLVSVYTNCNSEVTPLIPSLTSDSSMGYTSSALTADTPAWHAFTYSDLEYWVSINSLPTWLQIQIPTAVTALGCMIEPVSFGGEQPTNFVVQGSVDGSGWTTLISVPNETWTNNPFNGGILPKGYTFTTTGSYNFYRIYATGDPSGYVGIVQWQLYTGTGISYNAPALETTDGSVDPPILDWQWVNTNPDHWKIYIANGSPSGWTSLTNLPANYRSFTNLVQNQYFYIVGEDSNNRAVTGRSNYAQSY